MMHPLAALVVKHPAVAQIAAAKPYTHDESHIGVWLWVVLIVGINVAWGAMDVWLYVNHHEMLTTEFREGLKGTWQGPLIAFLLFGAISAFIFHMFVSQNPGQGG